MQLSCLLHRINFLDLYCLFERRFLTVQTYLLKRVPRQYHYYLYICHHDVTLLLFCFISTRFFVRNTKRHRLRIFSFRRKIMFRSQDIQFFVFLAIPLFTESVTSRWILVHETRYIFEYIFWTTTHEITKLGQLIDIRKGNNFQ